MYPNQNEIIAIIFSTLAGILGTTAAFIFRDKRKAKADTDSVLINASNILFDQMSKRLAEQEKEIKALNERIHVLDKQIDVLTVQIERSKNG
jgi:predicted  nucleic acid-binding Zn-ribbon protein